MDEQEHVEGQLPVVAVVDAVGSTAVIWWVDVAGSPGLSPLCGAWELRDASAGQVFPLVAGRHVLATPAGRAMLQHLEVNVAAMIEAEVVREAVQRHLQVLVQAHQEHCAGLPAARRNALIHPVWPDVPAILASLPKTGQGHQVTAALALARWVASLCAAWKQIEGQRVRRPHLRPLGASGTGDLPLRADDPLAGAQR